MCAQVRYYCRVNFRRMRKTKRKFKYQAILERRVMSRNSKVRFKGYTRCKFFGKMDIYKRTFKWLADDSRTEIKDDEHSTIYFRCGPVKKRFPFEMTERKIEFFSKYFEEALNRMKICKNKRNTFCLDDEIVYDVPLEKAFLIYNTITQYMSDNEDHF